MKTYALAVLMLLAGASALPALSEDELRQQRFVTDTILEMIESFRQRIRDSGLDPYYVKSADSSFALSEPDIVSGTAFVEEFSLLGLSDIRVNSISFSILTQRLIIDVSWARVSMSVGASGFEMNFFNREISGQGSGSLEIVNLGLKADVRASVGVISGITIRSIDLDLYLNNVLSDLSINVFNRDISNTVNNVLNGIPNFIRENKDTINDLLEYIAWYFVDRMLG